MTNPITPRLFVVTRRDSNVEHVVRATGRTIAHGCDLALGHIAATEYDVRHASVDDLVRLLPTHPVESAAAPS